MSDTAGRTFGKTASALSKNPLGIIALFIVLVYGLASMVTVFSGTLPPPERLPLIYFLVLFPVLVLGVFGWLVSQHPRVLYGPSDFRNEAHYVTIATTIPPSGVIKDLAHSRFSVETAENFLHGIDKEELIANFASGKLTLTIREYPPLTHLVSARIANGEYPVRVFLEFYDDVRGVASTPHRAKFSRKQIAAVHYLLHESFGKRLITSTSQRKEFEAWLSIRGEFTIIAIVEHKDGSTIALSRYLSLPKSEAVDSDLNEP
jgi:prokaryotic YEATS domain